MGMLVGTVGALSTFYPDAKNIDDLESRRMQTRRLIGKMPTLAAFAYRAQPRPALRLSRQRALATPATSSRMLFKMTELEYKPNPVLERALDVLFILHADHEQNCSTNAMRCVGSSHADPYSAVAAAAAALYGPLHGGANEAVIRMLQEIGSVDKRARGYIKQVKAGERRLMGFGHRVYKNYDPRAKIIKQLADEVFEVTGQEPAHRHRARARAHRAARTTTSSRASSIRTSTSTRASSTRRWASRSTMFPVLFAIPRTAGWMAQWAELVRDPEQRIARPRQIYAGESERTWVPIDKRPEPTMREDAVARSI